MIISTIIFILSARFLVLVSCIFSLSYADDASLHLVLSLRYNGEGRLNFGGEGLSAYCRSSYCRHHIGSSDHWRCGTHFSVLSFTNCNPFVSSSDPLIVASDTSKSSNNRALLAVLFPLKDGDSETARLEICGIILFVFPALTAKPFSLRKSSKSSLSCAAAQRRAHVSNCLLCYRQRRCASAGRTTGNWMTQVRENNGATQRMR
ncbi:hypothetical protein EVAR_95665_1 [Eumeta japonica]|uniref:Uncharacterized protein n=1 Tax=Eumeta variegata TaxID=151549 RepID=A0A4C1VIW4_EUMVA|nr:hypothetical protein EVAR_95665_1 [Eumeta japonica]